MAKCAGTSFFLLSVNRFSQRSLRLSRSTVAPRTNRWIAAGLSIGGIRFGFLSPHPSPLSAGGLISVKRLFFTKGILMISVTCTYFLCSLSVFSEKPLVHTEAVELVWAAADRTFTGSAPAVVLGERNW